MTGAKLTIMAIILCVMVVTAVKVFRDQNQQSLYEAVINTNSAKVVRMLASGVKPEYRNAFGSTPLMQAATQGNPDMSKVLIEYGADVNAEDVNGNSVLFYAVNHNNGACIEELIGAGANINHINSEGFTPLLQAIEKSHVAATRALLKNGADLQIKGPNGETAEQLARTRASPDVLFEIEAVLHNWQPLHMAAAKGDYLQVMKLIQTGADVNITTDRNLTPLALAVRGEHLTIVNLLFDNGAEVELADDNGEGLLSQARKGLKQETAILVESKIDNWNRLMQAAAQNDLTSLELLISRKEDLESRSRFKRTALMVAVNQGNFESVRALVEHGAKINIQDEFGWSPLMYASHLGHKKITQYLLKNNARIDYYDDYCNSALKLSIERIGRDGIPASVLSVSDEKRVAIQKRIEQDPVFAMLRKAGSQVKNRDCKPQKKAKSIGEMISTNNWLAHTPVSLQSSL